MYMLNLTLLNREVQTVTCSQSVRPVIPTAENYGPQQSVGGAPHPVTAKHNVSGWNLKEQCCL